MGLSQDSPVLPAATVPLLNKFKHFRQKTPQFMSSHPSPNTAETLRPQTQPTSYTGAVPSVQTLINILEGEQTQLYYLFKSIRFFKTELNSCQKRTM